MSLLLNALLVLITVGFLAFAGVAVYALILLIRRPPLALYEARKAQSDFLRLDQLPARQIELVVRQEDRYFYTHPGYDIMSIRRAWRTNHQEGQIVLGASTITQQLAKNLYLRFTKSYLRKLTELLIALRLERTLGKDRILELYVNIIYFGNGTYGISDAARFYFGRPARDLTLNQMVMLSIIPSAPTMGNPIQHPEVFEHRRNEHLKCFTEIDPPLLSRAEAEAILAHGAACLDPELRRPDAFTRSYPRTIPMINERFGPDAAHKGV